MYMELSYKAVLGAEFLATLLAVVNALVALLPIFNYLYF